MIGNECSVQTKNLILLTRNLNWKNSLLLRMCGGGPMNFVFDFEGFRTWFGFGLGFSSLRAFKKLLFLNDGLPKYLLELGGEDRVVLDGKPVPVALLHVGHLVLCGLVAGHEHNLKLLPRPHQVL